MDSMTGIFYEESSRILFEVRNKFADYENKDEYGLDLIQEIFRVVHTLKANATMMLFDGIASISKKFESLLYCFRNGPKVIEDTKCFDNIFAQYMDYVEHEIEKIPYGIGHKQPSENIVKDIDEYVKVLKQKYQFDETKITTGKAADASGEKARQIYYIPGASSFVTKNEKAVPQNKYENKDSDGVVVIKKSEIIKMQQGIELLSDILADIQKTSDDGHYILDEEKLHKLFDIDKELNDVTGRFTMADFSAVAQKMDILVEEMATALHKNVKLVVSGESVMVDKAKREKISSALIHIIRNSVDHGIEDLETRERLGKSPMGLVKLEFKQKGGKINISVSDDGAGIDSEKVLEAAKKADALKKKPEEYTYDEILELLLINGVSTTNIPNDYSGRGVGMDVINHNIKEIGGKLKITSEKDFGTKIEIEV